VNNSTLLVLNESKKVSKPIESPHSVPGPCIQQNSLLLPLDPIFLAQSKLPTRDLKIFYSLLARSAEKMKS